MPYIIDDKTENSVIHFVETEYFSQFNCQALGKIDFCVTQKLKKNEFDFELQSFFWAEAKKKKSDIVSSIAQLILTIGKDRTFTKYLPPRFLGCFDEMQIAFIPYDDIQEVFFQNDFNWNVTPSDHTTKEFKQLEKMISDAVNKHSYHFLYETNDKEIRAFIKNNFKQGGDTNKIQVDRNNFVSIYFRWEKEVKPSIMFNWSRGKKDNIFPCDFFLADLISKNNITIGDMSAILKTDIYEVSNGIKLFGQKATIQVKFKDEQKAHNLFWNKYERPPRVEYQNYIKLRKDLLLPQDIRERQGGYFTPPQWVVKSQEYIAKVLGVNWQDEYYIWDCCAGTGNLLVGLTNARNIWASTLYQNDVETIKDYIKKGANLLEGHIFQFDFLNDDLFGDKVPKQLQEILKDKDKRKKLVIYINPPYAEATNAKTVSGTGKNKTGVSNTTKVHDKYIDFYGAAMNEIFVQFLVRLYSEMGGCVIANFSTIKTLQAPNFCTFRKLFLAKLQSIFLIPADTFDNVKGKFPIGFFIWDTSKKEQFKSIEADVYNEEGEKIETKVLHAADDKKNINQWMRTFGTEKENLIGHIECLSPDFQHVHYISITVQPGTQHVNHFAINNNTLIVACIYFSVRFCIEATWLNDRDQFLYPNDKWKEDKDFQTNCLVYTLFHNQNRITSEQGVNHWIPFTESQVGAHDTFESTFMSDFIAGKIKRTSNDWFPNEEDEKPLTFTTAAKDVLDAARELYRYYHKVAFDNGGNGDYNVNASLYDIRMYFQGYDDEKKKMNSTSSDVQYTKILESLKQKMATLAKVIEPKVYEYGFLIK